MICKTFVYDTRLDGYSYLVADYSIQTDDASHQNFVVYAAIMACVYSIGIPTFSFIVLWRNKEAIQTLQAVNCERREVERERFRLQTEEKLGDDEAMVSCEARIALLREQGHDLVDDQPLLHGLSPLYAGLF